MMAKRFKDIGSQTNFKGIIRDLVDLPLKQAGFRRERSLWYLPEGQIGRGISVQTQRKPDSKAISFTLNFGLKVVGAAAYFTGVDDENEPFQAGDHRIGEFLHPFQDIWWTVEDGKLQVGEPWGEVRSSNGSELTDLIQHGLIPHLLNIETIDRYLETPFVSPAKRVALAAARDWHAAGMPKVAVDVRPLDGNSGVMVEVARDFAEEREDLVEIFIERATPFEDAQRIGRVERLNSHSFNIFGSELRPARLKGQYQRFLAVRRFGPIESNEKLVGSSSSLHDNEGTDEDPQALDPTLSALGGIPILLDDELYGHDVVDDWIRDQQSQIGQERIWREDRNMIMALVQVEEARRLKADLLSYVERSKGK
jgi:hypothetical protein